MASATGLVELNRRTGGVTVGAEHAAITRLGFQQGLAVLALIEILARVLRHRFLFLVSAGRAGNLSDEFGLHRAFSLLVEEFSSGPEGATARTGRELSVTYVLIPPDGPNHM